jgi:hypothetical protein
MGTVIVSVIVFGGIAAIVVGLVKKARGGGSGCGCGCGGCDKCG